MRVVSDIEEGRNGSKPAVLRRRLCRGHEMLQKPSVFVARRRSPLTRPSGTLSPTGRGEPRFEARVFPVPLAPVGRGVRGEGAGPTRERAQAERPVQGGPAFHRPTPNSPFARRGRWRIGRAHHLVRQRFVGWAWLALVAVVASVSVAAQEYRRAPRFEGKIIPDPPGQGQPWTAPATKLPKFLVNATGVLFEQGVADPRGCEYRQVEIGRGSIDKVHGFVLPEQAGTPGRFAVWWDGQIYPALSVGEPADLDRDVNDLAAHLKRTRETANRKRFDREVDWSFPTPERTVRDLRGVDDSSPIKICLLLRLGRADLAEALFAAGTSWTPEPRARDLTDYHISYMTLAINWAEPAFRRLVQAHVLADDTVALDAARRLAKFRDLAAAKADLMGFPVPQQRSVFGTGPPTRFYFLTQLDQLLKDHERRAKTPPRGPIPKKGGDPSARIAALIRDLDQIDERQMDSPGGANPGNSTLVGDLIAMGDLGVAPLLEVLESDNRLTRSVSYGRSFGSPECFIHPVHEAAFTALTGILRTNEFAEWRVRASRSPEPAARKVIASMIRQFWEKNRSVALVDRWYRALADDSAGPARWLEAAGAIVQPVHKAGEPFPKPGTRPTQGEALRVGREPRVAALLVRRALEIERTGNARSTYDQGFGGACRMASVLAQWDDRASLPLLRDLMKECRARSDRWLEQEHPANFDRSIASYLAEFTQIRVKLGELAALDEYAAWLRTTTPTMLEYVIFDALKPLLAQPDQPALASAAEWLFTDGKSPWVPLLPEARGQYTPPFQNLFASPLLVVTGFRRGVLAALADKSPLGTVRKIDNRYIERKIKNLQTTRDGPLDLDQVAVGVEHPFRSCDLVAKNLSAVRGCPQCELFWPEARRDEAVAACVAYLKEFGASFTTEAPRGVYDAPFPKAHLRLPILGKPATAQDVASARAIFSLEGQGETRVASMPGFPQPARWVTLKDTPVDRTYYPEGVTRREYDTDGFVWQAEEVRKGDGWERFYGFIGHHVIGRAPASEIEFGTQPSPWWTLKGGLDARCEMIEVRPNGYEPGRPVLVKTLIRNRLGVAHASPTEFIRPDPDGKPALRKGIKLSLWHTPARGSRFGPSTAYANDVIEPKRDGHFDPGQGTRLLAPLETFEAIRLDLNDWFDLTKAGSYRVGVTFGADSGIGEGSAAEAYFRIGGDE